MREILFRGKRLDNGEWIDGMLFDGEHFAVIADKIMQSDWHPTIDNFLIFGKQVIPETIGQYTGLTDKNAKKIFEGDIVSGHLDDLFPEDETRYKVIWDDYGWHIRNSTDTDTFEQGWAKQYFEVIGNIYDDPELLGGKENV